MLYQYVWLPLTKDTTNKIYYPPSDVHMDKRSFAELAGNLLQDS